MASASHIYNGLKCIPMCSLPRLIRCSVCDSINQLQKRLYTAQTDGVQTTLSDVRAAAQMWLSCHRTPDNSSLYMRAADMEHLCEYLRTAYSNHCRKSRKYSYAYPARYIEISVDCFICLHDMCGPSCDFV